MKIGANMQVETKEQQALVQWLRLKNIFHFAPINENQHSKLNPKVAMLLELRAKSMGKVSGTSDIVVMLPHKILFIELKRQEKSKAKVSDSQKAFMENVNKYGYAKAIVCYGAKEAIQTIERELSLHL